MIFFIDVLSPGIAAEELWHRKPNPDELPALRAQSDLAWGFWVRQTGGAVTNINALWSTHVINTETRKMVNQAFKTYIPASGQMKVESPQVWPGIDFDASTLEGQSILGNNPLNYKTQYAV